MFYTHLNNFSFIKLSLTVICMIALFITIIVELKTKNKILDNKSYNILLCITNITTLIIILRDVFDTMMVTNLNNGFSSFGYGTTGSMFMDYNLMFILIMFISTLCYNLLNKTK